MISEKQNKEFLCRINWLLGPRQKHPWGRGLGLRNSRIDSIFKGIPPQVDGLEKIHRAERVNLHWLITGDGAPFVVPVFRDDAETAEALRARLGDGRDYRLHILAGRAECAVVLTIPVVVEYQGDLEASFTDVLVFQPAGERTLGVAAEWRDRLVLPVDSTVLAQLRAGWMGPRDLLGAPGSPGLLGGARPATAEEVRRVAEQAAAYQASAPVDEQRLVACYRRLEARQKEAVLVIAEGMAGDGEVGGGVS